MRPLLILALLAPTLAACGDDDTPVFADYFWRVRCDIAGGCPPDIVDHEIIATNGQEGAAVQCDLTNFGDTFNLNATATQGDFGIAIRNASFPAAGGGVVGSSCTVTVTEQGNFYEGGCSAAPPSGECTMAPVGGVAPNCPSPCQLSVQRMDEEMGPTIRASLFCAGLGLRADPSRVVEVNQPGDPTMPARLRIVNCPGS
ncbi:MAG: hypothetical protein AAGF12_16010 [Myxococcota bacterium]